jgi:hypothetical protein
VEEKIDDMIPFWEDNLHKNWFNKFSKKKLKMKSDRWDGIKRDSIPWILRFMIQSINHWLNHVCLIIFSDWINIFTWPFLSKVIESHIWII